MNTFGAYLRSFLTGGGGGGDSASYRQTVGDNNDDDPPAREPDACSASSVNLQDIIEEYDEPSRASASRHLTTARSGGGLSLEPASSSSGPPTQSYFSLSSSATSLSQLGRLVTTATRRRSGARADAAEETSSFYSALHDGFSLSDFDQQQQQQQQQATTKHNLEFLWSSSAAAAKQKTYNNNGNSNYNCDEELALPMMERSDFEVSWHELTYAVRPQSTLLGLWDELRARVSQSSARHCLSSCGAIEKGDGAAPAAGSITILQHVNGSFQSGQLTAVMGPSGAGKTSLLNILSRRREEGFTGSVLVAGNHNHHVRINAIPQDDHLLECVTVRENLAFASRLKNPHAGCDHARNVREVAALLGLSECLDTRTKNISGGQQKRLAIAQELLSKPDILILDEPTSGLDSLTCLKTLTVMCDLVQASRKQLIEPIAIVLTIHQPQQEAFNLFDKVYVMANGGTVIYDGPPGACTDFVERYSGLKMPSPDYNPASFLIEIASGEYGQEPIDALARQTRAEFKQRAEAARRDPLQDMQKPQQRLFLDPKLAKSSTIDSGSFCAKTRTLTERCWKTLWRDPKQVIARVVAHLIVPIGMAFMMGTEPGGANACPEYSAEYALKRIIDSDEYISPTRQQELLVGLENIGLLFMTIYTCIVANIAAATLMFSLDLKTCLKEHYNGWYSMNSFVFARLISNIPLDLILPTLTIAITYLVTGQNTGNGQLSDVYRVTITACGIVLASSTAQMMAMMFAAIYVGHLTTAMFAAQGATLPFLLLSGFVARTKNMTKFVRMLSMTSLFKHGIEITFIARYGYNVCGCDPARVAGKRPELTGVTDEMRNFVKYWMNSQEEDESAKAAVITSTAAAAANTTDDDIFQMIAKQIQLYNTYGMEISSCDQVIPYHLYDYSLTEADLPYSFMALIILFLVTMLMLLLVVKFLVSYRTSL